MSENGMNHRFTRTAKSFQDNFNDAFGEPAHPVCGHPIIRTPVIFVAEAKSQDIEGGLGQCAVQRIAAGRFDVRKSHPLAHGYACVTTGETWQFLRLDPDGIVYDNQRLFLIDVGQILAAFMHAVTENAAVAAA